nr:MAG TPA: hypothetical protein [Bacteriophage sp.]
MLVWLLSLPFSPWHRLRVMLAYGCTCGTGAGGVDTGIFVAALV